jgi:hypothetical protein
MSANCHFQTCRLEEVGGVMQRKGEKGAPHPLNNADTLRPDLAAARQFLATN